MLISCLPELRSTDISGKILFWNVTLACIYDDIVFLFFPFALSTCIQIPYRKIS